MEPGEDFISRLWTEYSGRIEEAKKRESETRLSLFCPQPFRYVGEFPITPLTLEKYCIITLPEFWSDPDPRLPVLRFLWIMSPDFDPDPKKGTEFILDHIQDDLEGYDQEIREIFNQAFEFAPKGSSSGKSSGNDWIATIIDLFASEYGWDDEKILQTPMDRLFIYLQRIQVRRSSNPVTFSTEADRLKKEFMDIVNKEKVSRN